MIHTTFAPNSDSLRETRTIRLPDHRRTELFPGWGPKV